MTQRSSSVVTGVRRLLSDVVELAELQCHMTLISVRQSVRPLVAGALLTGVASILTIVAVVAATTSGTCWLHDECHYSWFKSFGISTGILTLMSVTVGCVGAIALRRGWRELSLAAVDLEENVGWIRQQLSSDSHDDIARDDCGWENSSAKHDTEKNYVRS